MDGPRFDDFTRMLVSATSRRRLLRGLAGGVLGLAGVRTAAAKNACSEFCKEVPPGPQRGQCRSDCAKGTGLFFACGGEPGQLCEQVDGTVVCCPSGQDCVGGVCAAPPPPGCTSNADCADGDPCTEDICDTSTGLCSNPAIANCCITAAQCDDGTGDACTTVTCVENVCGTVTEPGCISCTEDLDCIDSDDDICTMDECVQGRCVHTPIEDCGPSCFCPLKQEGESCESDAECCSSYCSPDGECTTHVEICSPVGGYCSDSPCCSDICEECQCTCLPRGDTTCVNDSNCCGGFCGPNGCCGETGTRCTGNDDCCGGNCIDTGEQDDNGQPVFICEQGSPGTPCNADGQCINDCTDAGVCTCSQDNWCFDDSDCCNGYQCVAQPGSAPFAGVCG